LLALEEGNLHTGCICGHYDPAPHRLVDYFTLAELLSSSIPETDIKKKRARAIPWGQKRRLPAMHQ
jgi:hypothetical protein